MCCFALPLVVTAQSVRSEDVRQNTPERELPAPGKTDVNERKEAAATGLTATKLKVCLKRQAKISNIMARIANRGSKQIELFNTIAERTQNFYTEKGKTLTNYDALVADVAAKKAAAQEAVAAISIASIGFDCNSENPKGMASNFQASLKSEIETLKAYKTSVKNLIVGVKSVQSTLSPERGESQ